ncbi:MAG: acyltransferase family protein, partial [Cyanobium sp.]
MKSLRLGYRPEIDGLRALAVIAVVLNHTRSEWLPSGYLGVDIFFVISGFVITSSLLLHGCEGPSDFFLGFYARRFKRILPALVVFVLIAGGAIAFFSPGGPSLRTGAAALFGLANMYLFREATDYFGQASELNMFTHMWSLGVEEQFYFIYPLLVWFAG